MNNPFDDVVPDAIREYFDRVGGQMTADIKVRLDIAYPPASAPGESPHRRTGFLQNSIQYSVTDGLNGLIELFVFSDCYYAGFLEFGTSKMYARPFFAPAQVDWTPQLISGLGEFVVTQFLQAA